MNKTEVRATLDGNKAQMHCPYCDALISFRIYANNLLDPEGPTCKHLDDWSHKGEVVKAHFKQGKETAMSERKLSEVLDGLEKNLGGIAGQDIAWEGYMREARAIGEKMQAEINALRGGIEAHKAEGERRAGGNPMDVLEFDHTASYVALPVMLNGLKRGHARLPIVGHCGDPDGCAIIVRLGKVEFPLPIDFDPSK